MLGGSFNADEEEDTGAHNQPQGDHALSVKNDATEICLVSTDFKKMHDDLLTEYNRQVSGNNLSGVQIRQ